MHYIIIDLEFNNMRDITEYYPDFNINQENFKEIECPNEIIQIGAVKLDKYMKKVDSLKLYVKPAIYGILNPRITEITGITEKQLETGVSFSEALNILADFAGEESILCSWAKDDIAELIRNSNYHNCHDIGWIKEYIDIQEYCTKILAERKSLSLKSALDKLRVKVDEKELHDALNDALYTAEVFKRVFNIKVIKNYIVRDIINMPSIMIRDYENFTLEKDKIELECPKCSSGVELEYPLRLVNWRFMGLGYCCCCNSKILQEVVIKKTLRGEKIYNSNNRIIDEVEYSDFAYRLRQTS